MNVTNRQKSTDADTPQPTQPTQQQQQLLAYASCRQAATATGTPSGARQDQLQCFQRRVHEVLEENHDDQEQVVTSTSSDCLLQLSAEGEGEEVTLEMHALVTSPARITSSTNNYEILTYNSDSLSREEMVMPSTSDNSRLDIDGQSRRAPSLNSITLHNSINTRILKSSNDMVARDTPLTAIAKGGDSRGAAIDDAASTSSSSSDAANQNHKIILKLPKPSLAAPFESHSLSSRIEDDLRKVEPLKINLHNTHHTSHHTPKITIKPVVKEPPADMLMSSEECSSSAEDEMVSKLNASEPHIVPKLTIRAKNEELSTVVPKLTIKINDSVNASAEGHNAQPAANTPPLPKLTIKTGQDGHSESIITNISPASSTTSSSSSSSSSSSMSINSNVPTNSSAVNVIPKLTIKPLQKSHEIVDSDHPSIPKLCIKSNTICAEMTASEDASTSKIPKLTIKKGQERAVIITQHNDHSNILGGIPKLTITTKSMDSAEDAATSNVSNAQNSPNEKIPKITIKTNNMDSPNIVTPKRSIIKSQLESSHVSPKQAVPKLTITRQQNDMVVTNKHSITAEEECSGSIPKMTIKNQSKTETVPKLTIKNISCQPRPSSTEESGVESDNEYDENVGESNSLGKLCKTVPKLTIKNLGSPQQKLTVVQETPLETYKSGTASNPAVSHLSNVNIAPSPANPEEFNDLLNVDNGGGESSNSQEFCGFNENTADSSAKVVVIASSDLIVSDNNSEVRRNSDDMDIDEDLRTSHQPKTFQNDIIFQSEITDMPGLLNGTSTHSKITQIIDTVDLTSSPSRSCSPAQFDYNDDSNSAINVNNVTTNLNISGTNILLSRLQRESTVIQNTQHVLQQQQHQIDNNSPILPPLQPKPNAIQSSQPASLKYPQLAERLMANGTNSKSLSNNSNNGTQHMSSAIYNSKEENIIDSIEILDTPEGSPRNSLDERPDNLLPVTGKSTLNLPNGIHYPNDNEIYSLNNNNSNFKRHALTENLTSHVNQGNHSEENIFGELTISPTKKRRLDNEAINTKNCNLIVHNNNELLNQKVLNSLEDLKQTTASSAAIISQSKDFNCLKQPAPSHQRSRKQKHENLLPVAMEEVMESVEINSHNNSLDLPLEKSNEQINENATPVQKKRGRPRKLIAANANTTLNNDTTILTPQLATGNSRDGTQRRVQLLRKRLAIDMVDADEPLRVLDELESSASSAVEESKSDILEIESQKKERNLRAPLRTSRRSNTPTAIQMENKTRVRPPSSLGADNNKRPLIKQNNENTLNHFIESNSSISSAASNSSATHTVTVAPISLTSHALSMVTQIDLSMSSSSSNSSVSTTNTITTVEATNSNHTVLRNNAISGVIIPTPCVGIAIGGGSSSNNSMLPPTTILSSSDPLPDVVFKHNDFSSILATQQLRAPIMSAVDNVPNVSQFEDMGGDFSGPDNSGDDSASSSSLSTTPGRGRGRGRGSRGGRGRAYKAHRLGRNASAVSKAIAMNRPRCVGALKHTPDPDRIKGLYSPSPSVFEEDTRMSADLSQTVIQSEPPVTPLKQPDFLNNDESQSSIVSNTSILDPNNVLALQNVSSAKKPAKRKKMEVCVAEDAELTVSSIAEYDWPPPKGCCPSKNRDTFMIQEQVALYLGIKSFKRKYPDLPRRQIDMEERNYLQEKNLVSEKMCDLGITAVWASDILDIMYTDFYDKYEEYKDFVRQKHLREIEAKQKSLGLNVTGRGLQARDRALLSTSKWNAYFNRIRKEERLFALDLQTLTVNKACPASAPIAAIPNRPIAEAVARAAKAENIPEPPTLLKERVWEPIRCRDAYYPLSLVPGQFCEKYYDYSVEELRRFPLNTVLEAPSHILPLKQETSDTDSEVETVNFPKYDQSSSSLTAAERLSRQRRIRRTRAKHARKLCNDEFKVPPLPRTISHSSTESSSLSSDSSSETDSDTSSCSSPTSDENSEDENLPAICGVCQHPQNRNLKDLPELFLQCYTCRRKVHPSCIEMPHRMATRARNYNWQCADCKCCIKCKRKQDENKMLYCEQCDRGFHIYCLSIKAVPDGRWSCERCSICMRCGATKPEGQSFIQSNGEKLKIKHRKLKWINEYRIDHVTKLREHCSMLCVPCGRIKNIKRVQINTHHNTTNTYVTSPGSSTVSAVSPMPSPTSAVTATTAPPQISPNSSNGSPITPANLNLLNVARTTTTTTTTPSANTTTMQTSNTNQATSLALSTTTSSITMASNIANSLESKDSISLTTNSLPLTNTTTPQNTPNTTANNQASIITTANALPLATITATTTTTAATATATATPASGVAPPVVA